MPLVAASVCPHPPLLVPELAAGAAGELDGVRDACRAAVDAVRAAGDSELFVVGLDGSPRARSLAPWGVDVPVDVPEPLALSLLVGGWLTAGLRRSFVAVDSELAPTECAEFGAELAGSARRVALLVMGDGAARRSERAPGYLDPRAEPFDAEATAALATADTTALLRLDAALAGELLAGGRAAWQVLAGAAEASGGGFTGTLLAAAAPYGVGYVVATWLPR
jgi:hypothetical protein